MRQFIGNLLPSLVALAGAVLVSAIIVGVSGHSPLVAFGALLSGAFGGADSLSEVAVKTCPLLLTGLAVAVSFQAGVWNIGAEGQLLMGALAMAALGTRGAGIPGPIGLTVCLAGATVLGALWAAIAAQPRLRRTVNAVISATIPT